MKGQMFIIGTIIILVGVIFIKDTINIYPVINEKNYQDSIIDDKVMKNIENEFDYALGMAALNNKTSYMSNFSDYVRRDNYKVLYIVAIVNGTTHNYTVEISNYFGGNINYTLNATFSTPSGYSDTLNDRSNISYVFNSTVSTVSIKFNYTLDGYNTVENMALDLSRNFIQGFFDIKHDSLIYLRSKHIDNWSW